MALDESNGLVLKACNADELRQQWRFAGITSATPFVEDEFEPNFLKNSHTDECLSIVQSSARDGAIAELRKCKRDSPDQQWKFYIFRSSNHPLAGEKLLMNGNGKVLATKAEAM